MHSRAADSATVPPVGSAFGLLARFGVVPVALARVFGEHSQPASLQCLLAAGILDRVAARALALAADGQLDARDVKQLLDLPTLRSRLVRSATVPVVPPPPIPLPLHSRWGRFSILGLIGRGQSCAVYRSIDPQTGIPIALKVSADVEALRAEGVTLARIVHPNVVRYRGFEQVGRLGALALDLAGGGSLARTLGRVGAVVPAEIFRAGRDILRGLRATQKAGIVHGDVKPGNILTTHAGRYQLADFGTAHRAGRPIDGDGPLEGTWPYTAPECFTGPGDHRSDIYSLGLTLLHALTGRPPVSARGFEACREAHARLSLEPPHWTVPGVGREASALILRMSARDPARRPGDDLLLLARRAFRTPRRPAAASPQETCP